MIVHRTQVRFISTFSSAALSRWWWLPTPSAQNVSQAAAHVWRINASPFLACVCSSVCSFKILSFDSDTCSYIKGFYHKIKSKKIHTLRNLMYNKLKVRQLNVILFGLKPYHSILVSCIAIYLLIKKYGKRWKEG